MNENAELMPDWPFWRELLHVNLYAAIALSLNFDIENMPGYRKKTQTFTFRRTPAEFQRRFDIAENAIQSGRLAGGVGNVDVAVFVSWAKSLREPWAIPAELEVLRARPAQPSEKPWLDADSADPIPLHEWYVPARYFARQLVLDDSTLLSKRLLLADKVSQSLAKVKVCKRGGKKPFDAATVLKALSNINLG